MSIMKTYIFAFDFDGTLCKGTFPDIGEPRMWVIDYAKRMKLDGHKIILWTCRENCGGIYFPDKRYLDEAVEWCSKYGLVFDAVNKNIEEELYPNEIFSRKVYADYYIDDKSVIFDDVKEEFITPAPNYIFTNYMFNKKYAELI